MIMAGAFNAVRFQVKPGQNQAFLAAHQRVDRDWPGLRHVNIIQTGEHSFCIIGEWDSMDDLAAARPHKNATLDTFRDLLDGDTDPVSGPVVLELK
jgi:heme-degrading monooxygenase HmoA